MLTGTFRLEALTVTSTRVDSVHRGSDDVVAPGLPDPLDSSTAANPAVRQYIEHSLAIAEQSRQKGNYRVPPTRLLVFLSDLLL
jgi:hypothetical protein